MNKIKKTLDLCQYCKEHQNATKGTSKREIKNHKDLKFLLVLPHLQILHQVFPSILIIPHMHLQGQKA